MCNRKTKQWHIKPTLDEYKTMNVYCIVNKLKTVSEWDRMMEEVTTKVLTELTADLWLWSCEGTQEGMSWWAGGPLPLDICHIRYWAGKGYSLKYLDVVGSGHKSLQLQNSLNLNSHVVEHVYAQWCQFSSSFFKV